MEMLQCQYADQSARYSGVVVNAEIMYYTIILGHLQEHHMLISKGRAGE